MAIKTALENNDYQAFLDAMPADCPLWEQITQDNFSKFAQARRLMASGDTEGVKAIFDELGIKPLNRKGGPNKQFSRQQDN